jgi:hypothetical protein
MYVTTLLLTLSFYFSYRVSPHCSQFVVVYSTVWWTRCAQRPLHTTDHVYISTVLKVILVMFHLKC